MNRGSTRNSTRVVGYRPERLEDRFERQAKPYFDENPQRQKFKLHNLRGAAMTRAWMAPVRVEDAAITIAFACDPETMRKHELALHEQLIADQVLGQINGSSNSASTATDSREEVASASSGS